MLKQTVSAQGAPVVTIESYSVPSWAPAEEPEEEPEVTTTQQETVEPATEEPATQEEETTDETPVQDNKPETVVQPQAIPDDEPEQTEEQPPAKKPCIPAAMLLLLTGFVVTRR